jgi:hypothetical protein
MLQAGRSPVRVRDEVDFSNLPNPSTRTMALGSTQPLTEMSARNPPGDKKRLAPSMSRMSENVGTSTSHGLYRDNFFSLHFTNQLTDFLVIVYVFYIAL